ncbi:MAG: hypothetical protein R3E21_10635 [Caenibius sp.]
MEFNRGASALLVQINLSERKNTMSGASMFAVDAKANAQTFVEKQESGWNGK